MKYLEIESAKELKKEDSLEVVIYPFGSLRSKALPYDETEFGEDLLEFGKKMLATMYLDQGIGLAANQVNHLKRIFVMDVSEDMSQQKICINPEIITSTGSACIEEGCLSAPGINDYVQRYSNLKVRYYDCFGKEVVEDLDGLAAICFQHELDHLNGIMFFDHLTSTKKEKALKNLRKWVKKNLKK